MAKETVKKRPRERAVRTTDLKAVVDDLVGAYGRRAVLDYLERGSSTLYAWVRDSKTASRPQRDDALRLGLLLEKHRGEPGGIEEVLEICGFKGHVKDDPRDKLSDVAPVDPTDRIAKWIELIRRPGRSPLGDRYRRVAINASQAAFESDADAFLNGSPKADICFHWAWDDDDPLSLLEPGSVVPDFLEAHASVGQGPSVRGYISGMNESDMPTCKQKAQVVAGRLADFQLWGRVEGPDLRTDTLWWFSFEDDLLGYDVRIDMRIYASARKEGAGESQSRLDSSEAVRLTRNELITNLDSLGLEPAGPLKNRGWKRVYEKKETP